jgi:hypothetical protein
MWYAEAGPWGDKAYAFWPPFALWDAFQRARTPGTYPPVCLVHNQAGWGYGVVGERLRASIGLKCYGGYGSPDGCYPHAELPKLLAGTGCMVHLKSVDAPGYAVYEAMAAGCPVVIPGRFIYRCRAGTLLERGVTCLVFDDHDEPSRHDDEECVREVHRAVAMLEDPVINRRVGEAGRDRLRGLLWNDAAGFAAFLERHFPSPPTRWRPQDRPIFTQEFWAKRLEDAGKRRIPHLALFSTDHETWGAVEAKHRRILADLIKSDDSVLDVGCAYGRLLGLLPPGWHGGYLGIDLAEAFIAKARAEHPDHDFLALDLRELRTLDTSPRFDWGIVISVKRVIAGHAGQEVWDRIEVELKKRCRRILYLDYDANEEAEVVMGEPDDRP